MRDTHIRVEGDVIDALQIRFILDWNSQAHRPQFEYDDKYFPKKDSIKGNQRFKLLQVVQRFDLHQIEYGYTKMIMSAKIYIYAKPLLYSRSIVYQCT